MKNSIKKHSAFKSIFPFLLLFATLFMGIGYASMNSVTLDINGTVMALAMGEGIYITEVNYKDSVSVTEDESKIISAYQTVLNSKIVLSNDSNSSITYSITIYNNTNYDYTFVGAVFDESFYDNNYITFELPLLKYGDVVSSKDYITFDITFKYVEDVIPTETINELNSYLNFRFLRLIDYIESTGTQYIDTGYAPNNNTSIEMSFSMSNLDTAQAILGTRTHMDGVGYNIFLHNYNFSETFEIRWDENYDDTYINLKYNEGKKIKIVQYSDRVDFTTNGSTISLSSPVDEWSIDSNIYIFNQNQQNTPESRYALMKLYYLKIYQDGVLQRDFIPVLDNTGMPCLYDLVTSDYYRNQGTGNFEYGDEYTVVEYLESTGTQYIDTNYLPSSKTKVQFIMSLKEVTNTTKAIFGSRMDSENNLYNMFLFRSNLRWDYYTTRNTLTYSADITTPTYFSVSPSAVMINNDVMTFDVPTDDIVTDKSMYIYSINDAGSVNTNQLNDGMKVYYFKIYENGSIVKNYIPVLNPEGVACLYDLINEEYACTPEGFDNFISG